MRAPGQARPPVRRADPVFAANILQPDAFSRRRLVLASTAARPEGEEMRIVKILFAAVVALAAATPAAAQVATSRSGSSTSRSLSSEEYWLAVRQFGRCYAQNSQARGLALLATEPGSAEERAFFQALFRARSVSCLGDISRLSIVPAHLRGSIAEGFIRAGRGVPAALTVRPLAPGAPVRTISDAARCFTATRAAEVRALVRTVPGGEDEFQAVERLAPDFFACVPQHARVHRFPTTDVRYRLTEALLRMHPPIPAS